MSILTAVVVASWIGFSVWHNVNTSTIDKTLQIKISPIPDRFDTDVLESLRARKQVQINLSEPPLFIDSTNRPVSTQSSQQIFEEPVPTPASGPAELDPGTEL